MLRMREKEQNVYRWAANLISALCERVAGEAGSQGCRGSQNVHPLSEP
jgi:hypothetical protein